MQPAGRAEAAAAIWAWRDPAESEAPEADLPVEDLAALAAALLDHVDIDHALVAGHSMGGTIAQVLALDHPSRVSALLLSSTWARSDPYFERAFAQRHELLTGLGKAAYARAQVLAVLPPSFVAEAPEEAARMERAACEGAAAVYHLAGLTRAVSYDEFERVNTDGALQAAIAARRRPSGRCWPETKRPASRSRLCRPYP